MSDPATITKISGGNNVVLPAAPVSRQLVYVHSLYTASATVGNRLVRLQMQDADGASAGDWHVSPDLTAGVAYHLEFMPGTYREATFDANNTVQSPFPAGLIIPPGYSLAVFDSAGISTGDTQVVNFETINRS